MRPVHRGIRAGLKLCAGYCRQDSGDRKRRDSSRRTACNGGRSESRILFVGVMFHMFFVGFQNGVGLRLWLIRPTASNRTYCSFNVALNLLCVSDYAALIRPTTASLIM